MAQLRAKTEELHVKFSQKTGRIECLNSFIPFMSELQTCDDLIELSPIKPACEPEVIDIQAQRSGRMFSIRRQHRGSPGDQSETPLSFEATKSASCSRFQISRVSRPTANVLSDGTFSVEVSVDSNESRESDPLIDSFLV